MSDEYSLHSVLVRMYQNQQALEAALMELTLHAEENGLEEVGGNIRERSQRSERTRASSIRGLPGSEVVKSDYGSGTVTLVSMKGLYATSFRLQPHWSSRGRDVKVLDWAFD